MLNDMMIRGLKPSQKPQKFFDEEGLFLLLTPSGSRLWRFKYRFPINGPLRKEKALALGAYLEVSLKEARTRIAMKLAGISGTESIRGSSARRKSAATPTPSHRSRWNCLRFSASRRRFLPQRVAHRTTNGLFNPPLSGIARRAKSPRSARRSYAQRRSHSGSPDGHEAPGKCPMRKGSVCS